MLGSVKVAKNALDRYVQHTWNYGILFFQLSTIPNNLKHANPHTTWNAEIQNHIYLTKGCQLLCHNYTQHKQLREGGETGHELQSKSFMMARWRIIKQQKYIYKCTRYKFKGCSWAKFKKLRSILIKSIARFKGLLVVLLIRLLCSFELSNKKLIATSK